MCTRLLTRRSSRCWKKGWCHGASLGRRVDCRAILSARSLIGASTTFCFARRKFVSPFWLTMRQANELGGHVRKSEESTVVVFWKVEDGKEGAEMPAAWENDKKSRQRFLLRYYRVFNFQQCDLPQGVIDKLPKIERHDHDPISVCAEIMGCMPNAPEIQHAGSEAFYSALTDRVTLPPAKLFASGE